MGLETIGFHVFEGCAHCAYMRVCVRKRAHTPTYSHNIPNLIIWSPPLYELFSLIEVVDDLSSSPALPSLVWWPGDQQHTLIS